MKNKRENGLLALIIKGIRKEELLIVLGLALVSLLYAAYDIEKIKQIQNFLITIFIISAILIALDLYFKYKRDTLITDVDDETISRYKEELESLRREKAQLEEKLKNMMSKIHVAKGLDQYVINLVFEPLANAIDKENHYTKLVYKAKIDKEGNYKAKYEMHGVRVIEGLTKELIIQTGASFPIDYEQLGLKAYNLKTGKGLRDECLDDSERYRKIHAIYLDPIPKKLEPFSVGWEFTWPHCCAGQFEFDIINLRVFEQGVDELEQIITFPFEIRSPLLQEAQEGVDKLLDSEVQPVSNKEDGKFVYSYRIKKPKALGYVFTWVAP